MAAQGERECPGVVVMCISVLGPMAQDIPEQDIVMGEQELPPQMDPKPEMGTAAAEAAVHDTSPPPLYQNPPPIPAETVRLSAIDMTQLVAILAGIKNEINERAQRMESNMKGNAQRMESKMGSMNEKMGTNADKMEKMRGEMQKMGHGLQAGIMAFASEVRTTADKMAPPRATTGELRGSAPAGEDRVSRETCRTRHEVTEKKLNGVTETCTAGREVTELTEMREITEVEERLHGTDGVEEDAHTHTSSEGQWG